MPSPFTFHAGIFLPGPLNVWAFRLPYDSTIAPVTFHPTALPPLLPLPPSAAYAGRRTHFTRIFRYVAVQNRQLPYHLLVPTGPVRFCCGMRDGLAGRGFLPPPPLCRAHVPGADRLLQRHYCVHLGRPILGCTTLLRRFILVVRHAGLVCGYVVRAASGCLAQTTRLTTCCPNTRPHLDLYAVYLPDLASYQRLRTLRDTLAQAGVPPRSAAPVTPAITWLHYRLNRYFLP